MPASAKSPKAKAKAVILLHQFGGPSHLDTFDMKPDAPSEYRGEFKPGPTRVPGISICERLPRLAQIADKFTLIRSLPHPMKNHNSAGYYSLTGHAPPLDDIGCATRWSCTPRTVRSWTGSRPEPEGLPTFVSYPHVIRDGYVTPGQHASFLGKAHDPFLVTQDPNSPDFLRCPN